MRSSNSFNIRPPSSFNARSPDNFSNRKSHHVTDTTPKPTLGNRSPCQICGKSGHQALDCYQRTNYAYQGRHPPTQLAAMVAQNNAEFESQDWLADSGANAHITADAENITHPQQFEGNDVVGVGNGAGLVIKNTGSSFLHSNNSKFLLRNVLHCPKATANLLSINKFCLDNDCLFELTGYDFTVKDNQTGMVLLHGPCENGLYPIPLNRKSMNKVKGFTALLGVKTSYMVWHQRLGHPSDFVIGHLVSHHKLPILGVMNKNKVCEACQLGKSKQLPFMDSTRISEFPLDLIHSDVWTSPVPSLSGCKFYVIFIDDFSRFSWLYPILNKSDVFQCFIKFKLLVEKQFSREIKQIQTDNGGEYTSIHFKKILSTNGIFHHLTCPHTSQQNGIAERKHRHVVETGLTLLAQSGLSNRFWVDSFLTATYLINRLPTHVLNHESPYSKIFGKIPDYSLMRVFGSLCYPLLRPYVKHKLSFRSKPCIFVGYCANQRGYRCLDPQTQNLYF
jgi:hypothetical protein